MNTQELLTHLIDKVDDLFENIRHDDTYGEFKDGAKDYLLQVLDILVALQKEN
jgi:hypothetical protein